MSKSNKKTTKLFSILLCFLLLFEQSGFAQIAGQLDISGYLAGLRNAITQDKFRPLHLRYLSYDTLNNNFRLLLDKGDLKDIKTSQVQETTQKLLEYFFVGISLPNESFWVNLRPDSPDNIIDPYLAQTDVGKILLEADLQLKKDTAKLTSPENPKGKEYWDKLYKKAGELFGSDTITIPTLTRPWIVPDEIIVREANDNAYIYKATLKVQLEQDHLKDSAVYNFDDPRLKELNEYSSQLIRELIIPRLTQEINTSKRYASLRQVYYSLILAQWFKQKFNNRNGFYSSLIDRKNLNGLISKDSWSKITYFKEYQKSFQKGEYNIKELVYAPFGQTIRSYFSGGIDFGATNGARGGALATAIQRGLVQATKPGEVLAGEHTLLVDVNKGGTSNNLGVDSDAIKLTQSPIPNFGHSGNEVDGAIIEAQQAIQSGNIVVSLSKIKEAVRLLREVDFEELDPSGFPVADMVNQTDVAIWVLGQLKANGVKDKDVAELLKQLQTGLNGIELKRSLGYKPQERSGSSPATSQLGFSPKVFGEAVGIVRVIPDIVRDYRRLWEIKDNEIAVVDFYPTADPTFSRPMGIITSEETAGLSHAEVRARYWRIPHAVVKSLSDLQPFGGKWVYVKVTDAGVEFRLATADEIKNYESYKPKTPTPQLEEVDLTTKADILEWTQATNPKEVSHKFAGLHTAGKAQSYGSVFERRRDPSFYIHWGSVIPYAAYKRVLDANSGVEERVRAIVQSINNSDIDDIRTKLALVRELIVNMEISESIWGNAEREKGDFGSWSIDYTVRNETHYGNGVFVRTGTNAEDLPDYPGFGAGQYGTFPNVLRKDVKAAVKMAWASVWNEGAYIDRMKVGVDHFSVYPAVQLTKAIDAKYAFVVHTSDPNGEDQDKVFIEIVQGLGEGLVSDKYPGEAHRYVYSKSEDKIVKFDTATKTEKAVLNPDGGIKRAPTDYTADLFVQDREASALALDIARQAVAIEKAAGRPQDIEGAIEYVDYYKNYRWFVTQSRSEVGYSRAPTPWEEYFKANRQWAIDLIAKYRKELDARLPSSHFQVEVQDIVKKDIEEGTVVGNASASLTRKIRLFYSLGEEGRQFAGRFVLCGRGVHVQFQSALETLPLAMRADILTRAAVDYGMLDKEARDVFEAISNFNVARIIVTHKLEDLREIFQQMPPRSLAFLMEEVVAFKEKPKFEWEENDLKGFSWDGLRKIVADIYNQYPPEKQAEFARYSSEALAMWVGARKEEPHYRLTTEDYRKLFDWRYYHKPQAIILSAAAIDGCLGFRQFFSTLHFRLGRGEDKNPFHFFILMDIPNERPEDFLRRNGFIGDDVTGILMPSEVSARSIIWHVNNPINSNLPSNVLLDGDSIVIVGQEETVLQYRTTRNNVLTHAVLPQRGQIPLVLAEAINLLTKTHEDKETALSAWLVSRGLDGIKRYQEWVYQAERFLETHEQLESRGATAAEFNEKLYKPFASYVGKELLGADHDERDFSSFVAYLEKKNPGALNKMLYFSALELWGTKKEELIKFYRLMGAGFICNLNTWLIEHPALTREEAVIYSAEHDAEFREFIKKESSFPRDKANLEQLLTHDADMPTFVNMLTEIHQYYVVGRHEDAGFSSADAEGCIFHAIQHRRDSYVGYSGGDRNNLSAIVAQNPALLPWLNEIATHHGRVVVSGDRLSEGGALDYYVMMPQSDFRAVQRRARAEKGEDIDYNSCSDDDFSISAVGDGIMYLKYHYDVLHHGEPFDAGGRNADYGKRMEHGYRSFHFTDAFHAIYATHHYGGDVSHSQDLIEFMCYVERERIAQRRNLGPNDHAPAAMEIILHAVLRAKTEDMAQILSGTSPRILADLIHYAAVGYRNPQIVEYYLLKNQPQAKAIMRKLLEAQSEVRRVAIEKQLSVEAREFIAKRMEPYDAKKAERERRKALRGRLEDREASDKTKEIPPQGTPATLLRYMHANKIFTDNSKQSSEMAFQRGGNDSQRTIQRELQVLRRVGLVEGDRKGYHLVDWIKSVGIENVIKENPELERPGPTDTDISKVKEQVNSFRHSIESMIVSASPEPKELKTVSATGSSPAIQQVIPMHVADIPQQARIGEKPYKLLKMAQAGLNVPPFFIIITDGSGKITLTEEIRSVFGVLRKPAIVRSAHKDEGARFSFSGVFDSYGGITTLEPTPTEIISEDQEGYWDVGFKPEGLQSAYRLIVEGAVEDYRVKKYLKAHNIIDFNPNQMNVVVMEQVDFDVFGMFLTSNQNNPDEVLIHYQLIGKNAPKEKPERESGFFERSKEKGGVITYNKKTRELGENKLNEQTCSVLKQFGEVAGQIEKLFGVQQIELGAANGKVYVFQSRDINLSKPADAPRLAHYETLSEELHAIGYGYYHLPILVVDSLNKTRPEFEEGEEYKRLKQAYMSTTDDQEELRRERWIELNQLISAERNKYREELLRFAREHTEYILVIQDAEDVVGERDDSLWSNKIYDFLNQLASKAKVVIRGRNQQAIRHEDWDNVELGGITVIPPEESGAYDSIFISAFQYACETGARRSSLVYRRPSQKRDNVTIQEAGVIITGDYLNVLSNIDGVFVWVDNPLTGSGPSKGGSSPIEKNDPNELRFKGKVIPLAQPEAANGASLPGGVDFRSLPIITQAVANLNVNVSSPAIQNLRLINLDDELLQIQNLVKAGIEPSSERIKEYLQAYCLKDNSIRGIDKVILCILDILRQEEESCAVTDPVIRDILIVLEAINSSKELRKVFVGGVV